MSYTNLYLRLRALLAVLLLACLTMPGTAIGQATEPAADQTPYAALADILENEPAREQLIAELRRLAEQAQAAPAQDATATPQAAETAPAEPAADEPSLTRRIANTTTAVAEGTVASLNRVVASFAGLQGPGLDMAELGRLLVRLAVVIVGTIILFLVLRGLARPLFAQAAQWSERGTDTRGSMRRRFVAIVWSAAIDLAAIALAAFGGYLIALYALGEAGAMDTGASLFLNAFVLVEVFKAVLRMIFAARYERLRLFPMPSDVAEYWNAWLARLSGFIGYGLLFLVPVVKLNVAPALGQLVGLLIMAIAYVYALVVILRNRALLRSRLEARARTVSMGLTGVLLRLLAKTWHLWAIAYFTVLFVVSQIQPEGALPFMMLATVQTVLAIGGGMLLSAILTRLLTRPLRLSGDIHSRVPALQRHLSSYVPIVLKVIRVIIGIAVVLLVLDAWSLLDVGEWLASEAGGRTAATLVDVAIIVVVALLLWIAIASVIEHRLSPEPGARAPTAREKTLLALFRNALAIVIVTITAMVVLSEIGIDIGPLIAGAGVLGLAIGFGAQKMVQDVITGVFIQMENALSTGDVVTLAGISGTAEHLSIRSVGVRDLAGTYHLIPFSSVDVVSNYMREFAYHVGEYRIAYREDIDEAIRHLRAAYDELAADETQAPNLLGPLEVPGVTSLAESSVNIRVMIMTMPGTQWGVGRAYNRLVKKHFDAAGIEVPFPHLMLYFGQDKAGEAPPAHVRLAGSAGLDELPVDERTATASRSRKAGSERTKPADDDEVSD